MAAGLLIRNHTNMVLLVKPTYKDSWDLPGGYVEQGESPAAACSRELAAGLNYEGGVGRVLVIDWAPHPEEGDKVLWVFDGGTMAEAEAQSLRPDGDEIAEARFWAAAEVDRLMLDLRQLW